MFIEVTDISNGPRLLNLNYVVQIYDASSMGGGCIIYTTTDKIRVQESYSQFQLYTSIYNDESRIK
jgi:hypothetical protein